MLEILIVINVSAIILLKGSGNMKVKIVVIDEAVKNKCGQGCQAEGSCRC